MIQKVNRPSFLSLVSQPKASENDPGGSQGSGNFYEEQHSKAPSPAPTEAKLQTETAEEESGKPKLSLVVTSEQIGMTEVVKEFLEQKKTETPMSPGFSIRYTSDSQPAKGLLLNKKAE